MADLTVGVNLVGHDSLTPVLEKGESAFQSLTKGFFAFNQAQQALGTVGGAISGFAQSLTGPAQEMEAARARINAFTKDAGTTEDILRAVRAEADKTPFSFGEMAKAAASLGPTAKRAGVDLSSLLQTAEALSAADPAQGFEGAVMALREAMSGDLMSLRERFEVDTKEMNAAIQAGVSPIEAITAGLEKQGINLDMVQNLAQTSTGKMSTFNDMLEGLRRTAGEQILAGFTTQLDSMSKLIQDNMPVLQELAKALGQGIAAAIELAGAAFAAFAPILRDLLVRLAAEAPTIIANFQQTVRRIADQVVVFSTRLFELWQQIQPVITVIGQRLQPVFDFLARNLTSVVIPAFVILGAIVTAQAAAMVIALLPVVAPIAAIGVAIMLLNEAWQNNWGDIQGKTAAVWEFLSTVIFPPLQAFFELLTTVILPALGIGWAVTWDSLQTKATDIWTFLNNSIFTPLGAAYALLTDVILPALSKKWDEDWQAISDKADTVWKFLSEFVFNPIGAAMDLLRGVWLPALRNDWDSLWTDITTKAGQVRDDITGAVNILQENITNAWNTISTNVRSVVDGIAAFLVQSWDSINRQAGEWWTMVKDTIWNSIKPLADLIGGLVKGVQEALNSIKVPDIKLPSIGGAASTAAAAAQAGFNWATYNYEKNTGASDADARKKAEGRGAGGEVIGGDIAASGAGENALRWAMARLGQAGWVGWCQRFVENAFGTGGRYASAWTAAKALMTNTGGSLAGAPRGSLVFFRPDPSNGGFGHVGISIGDGRMVSATNNGPEVTGMNSYWNSLFAGWGPPRFAGGVRGFGGGWAVVGEKGWELAQLPKGTNVYSHEESKSMVGAGGGGATILVEVPISIDGEVLARVNRTYQSRFESRNRVGGVGGLS